jgi:ElaB/YqjD/DUF883 family membrane-anchored ribosome-binding protein
MNAQRRNDMDDITRKLPEADQQRLADDLRTIITDAEQLLKHAVRDAGQGYGEARAKLEESLRTAKAELAIFEQALMERVVSGAKATDAYVHESPWQAVGIGAGIGLLVGYILGRR